MDWNLKMFGPTLALTMVGLASSGYAATRDESTKTSQQIGIEACDPIPPAPCYSIDVTPECEYCLGPENVAGNPAVRPFTCNGDFVFTVAGLFWNAHEDGLAFAVENNVTGSVDSDLNPQANTLVAAKYLNPDFKWNWGWKLGFGYDSTHDGWDFGVLWTHYNGKAKNDADADTENNLVLLPLFSDFVAQTGVPVLQASQITANWRLKLDVVDLELGREFWNSKYVTLRPHAGLRILWVNQDYNLLHRGLSWSDGANDDRYNGHVEMENDFRGVGIIGGLDSVWNIGRGFAFFGNVSMGLIYGRFSVSQDEDIVTATSEALHTEILELKDHFRATKATTDLALGFQYSTMFDDCKYNLTIGLAWEHHMFFNQNQLWRVSRVDVTTDSPAGLPNPNGENTFIQTRGDLSTQGWTLSARLEF